MKLRSSALVLLLTSGTSLMAQGWFVAPKYSTNFTAKTERDTTGYMGTTAYTAETKAKADRDLDSYGLSMGKNFDSWRAYASYDTFSYDLNPTLFADKNIKGWVLTANTDYIYNVTKNFSLFAGAALTVAGSEPDGMTSDPEPGYGFQLGVLVDVYKTAAYGLSLEAGYRRIYTDITAKERNNAQVLGALQSQNSYTTSVEVQTLTTELSNSYISLCVSF